MNWLTRLLTPSDRIKEDERRTRDTEHALTLVQNFTTELRRDIDRKKRETDVAESLLRARDQRDAAS